MTHVLDASVAVKWFAPDGDADDEAADRILKRLARQSRQFVVPELSSYEVLAVLLRRLGKADAVSRAMRRLDRLGLRRVRQDPTLVEAAARLAPSLDSPTGADGGLARFARLAARHA